MHHFNNLDDTQKRVYHEQLLGYAQSIGGVNFFLQLLEAIREAKPHPLTAANREFTVEVATIKWNKAIFQDKIQLLQKARIKESEQNNLLPNKGDKGYKKILNLVRTLKPIVFTVMPLRREDGAGFILQPFDVIAEHTTKLNPIFDALFFCSVDTVKKVLNYKA